MPTFRWLLQWKEKKKHRIPVFPSPSIRELDHKYKASQESRYVFKALARKKVFPNQWDVLNPSLTSLRVLKKRIFKKSLILERNKSQDWDRNHDSKVKAKWNLRTSGTHWKQESSKWILQFPADHLEQTLARLIVCPHGSGSLENRRDCIQAIIHAMFSPIRRKKGGFRGNKHKSVWHRHVFNCSPPFIKGAPTSG